MLTTHLIAPHGGTLINRLFTGEAAAPYLERARAAIQENAQVTLTEFFLTDLELIATGVISPISGFMNSDDYHSVVHDMRLTNGLVWTIPVTLPVDKATADRLKEGRDVALLNEDGEIVGLLELTEKYTYNKIDEAQNVYRTTEEAHPGVARVYSYGDYYLAGPVYMLTEPQPDFPEIYRTPEQTRALFAGNKWRRVVAFQTRNPIHRAHEYLLKCALEMADGLMLHPLVGVTKSDDIPAHVRVQSYKIELEHYFPKGRVFLSAFPASMRYAGPREAMWHALCRKNYGCTHFIVGRDHAGVGGYYGTYDSQQIFDQFEPQEIGITPLLFEHAFYCTLCRTIVTAKTCPHESDNWLHLSGTQVRQKLRAGEMLPQEFTRPEVSHVLVQGMQEPDVD